MDQVDQTKVKQFMITPNSTVLYQGCAYWYSDKLWNDPPTGCRANPNEWVWLGSPGWFGTKEIKEKYEALCRAVGRENLPQWPGEYIEIDAEMLII